MSKSTRRDRHGKKKTTKARGKKAKGQKAKRPKGQKAKRPKGQKAKRPKSQKAKGQKAKRPKGQKAKSKHGYDATPLIDWAIVGERLRLSGREIDIARLLCQGRTTFSIAYRLDISVNTVKIHLKRLYKKCHVHDRISLVMHALSAVSAGRS